MHAQDKISPPLTMGDHEAVASAGRAAVDPDKLAALIEAGGALSRHSEFFEERPGQIEMLRRVCAAFNDGGILAVEAGTGVGKSLAYLIPALAWCAANDERVVVSTATINLQEQLIDKDIPLVKRLMRKRIPTALVKGRGNYLCLARLHEYLEETRLINERNEELDALVKWSEGTPSGDRADLAVYPTEELWSSVCSEADACTGLRCSNRERCFVLRVRRTAAEARLIVVNHHLLFSDLALRLGGAGFEATAVLPPFRRLVFDEAHNIESGASSYFSSVLNRFQVFKTASRLLRVSRGRRFGALVRLAALFESSDFLSTRQAELIRIRERAAAMDAAAMSLVAQSGNLRLVPSLHTSLHSGLFPVMAEFRRAIEEFGMAVGDAIDRLAEKERESAEAYETRLLLRRLDAASSLAADFLRFSESPERVFWIERRRTSSGDGFAQLVSTPLDISAMMREAVYEPFDSVVCTSATLTVGGSFTFWKSRIGLNARTEDGAGELVTRSPFDFASRVLVGIPDDAPVPDSPAFAGYLADFVARALSVSEGRALVLFTSYDMLSRTCEAVRPTLAALGIAVLRQGDDERTRLLHRFRTDISSVLFATDSFWEGVDSPGETLQLVVLCKLPFKVPTDPVLVARMEAIEARGGNAFVELSLPEAVMKFKQGFGRLMRRSSDRGCVLVPDRRLLSKSYGAVFLSSLPQTRRSIKSTAGLLEDLENFLAQR